MEVYGWNRTFEIYYEKYCVEYIDALKGYRMFFCSQQDVWKVKVHTLTACAIISAIFLSITIIAYVVLNETANVYGKSLVSYCASLLATFIALIIVNLNPKLPNAVCVSLGKFRQLYLYYVLFTTFFAGFFIMFSFIATFTWLNILCLDMWWTFG